MSYDEYEFSFRDYEKKCNEIQKRNEIYLEEFEKDLLRAGLKEKTIRRHLRNVDFYLNIFLVREEPLEMESGTSSYYIDDFHGYFLICKCSWSTPTTIRSSIASIKKFYKSMLERGRIKKTDYEMVIEAIKENKEIWIKDCKAYNDPNSPNPFNLFDIF